MIISTTQMVWLVVERRMYVHILLRSLICFIPLSHIKRDGPWQLAIVSLCAILPCSRDEGRGKEGGRKREREREREKYQYRFRRTIYPRKKLYFASSTERTAFSSSIRTAYEDRAVIIDARVRILRGYSPWHVHIATKWNKCSHRKR